MCWVTPVSSGLQGTGRWASQLRGSQRIAPRGPGRPSQSPGGAGETAWPLRGDRWARGCPAAAVHWLAWPKGSTTAHQSLRPKGTLTETQTHTQTQTATRSPPTPTLTRDGNPLDMAWGRKHGSWAGREPGEGVGSPGHSLRGRLQHVGGLPVVRVLEQPQDEDVGQRLALVLQLLHSQQAPRGRVKHLVLVSGDPGGRRGVLVPRMLGLPGDLPLQPWPAGLAPLRPFLTYFRKPPT